MRFTDEQWLHILDVWRSGQIGLSQVPRWGKYVERDQGARPQNSLQHPYALVLLGKILLERLRRHVELDGELVMTALLVHDHGEGEIGHDTLYIDKTVGGDVQEYLAFVRRYRQLDYDVFEVFRRAFLLQFVLKRPEAFPFEAREIMRVLRRDRYKEALAFEAIEYWDYVLYALEQYCERSNARILVQVLRNIAPHLDRLAGQLPGFWARIRWSGRRKKIHNMAGRLDRRKSIFFVGKRSRCMLICD